MGRHTCRAVALICVFFTVALPCARGVVAPKLLMHDGNKIPVVALGTWLGNDSSGKRITPRGKEVEEAVLWALDAGYRHIDTAYVYKTEEQVGRALARKMADGLRRDHLFITTKLWNEFHGRNQVVPALRESLRLLNLEYVDLYLVHWPVGQYANASFDSTDYLETWRGMMEAKRLGLTRSIGLSNFNQQQIDRILEEGLEVPAALQVEITLNLQQPGLRAYCKKHDIVVMGYSPFGSLFPEKAKPGAPGPRVNDTRLSKVAYESVGLTVPQIVLRYLYELGIVVIPKSLTQSRIESNINIFHFELEDDIKQYLKSFDRNYRTLPQLKWKLHPYYPFEWNLS